MLLRLGITLVAAQAALLLSGGEGAASLWSGVRAALGALIVLLTLDVARLLAGARRDGPVSAQHMAVPWAGTFASRLDLVPSALRRSFARLRPWHVVLAAVVLIAASTWRSPARLTVNVAGFLAFAGPLWWIVQRGAGRSAATLASVAAAIFAVVALTVDLPTRRFIEDWRGDSAYKWSAGWPTADWRVAQTIRLPDGSTPPAQGYVLQLPLGQRYDGASVVLVTYNGAETGAARFVNDRTGLAVDVAPGQIAPDGVIRIELRASPPDPALRLIAIRWTGGATLGADASSYFDGERWRSGTFNDVVGRAQPGVYVARLEPAGS